MINGNFSHKLEDMIEIFKLFYNCQIIFKIEDIYLDYIIKK